MANWCEFDIRIVGSEENCKLFQLIIQGEHEKKFSRVFNAWVVYEEQCSDRYMMELSGNCAWSVACAMNKEKHNPDELACATLQGLSAELCLAVEVYAREPGVGFAEHYWFVNGEMKAEECVDYTETYWDKEEYPTVAELNAEYDTDYSESDFNDEGYRREGGFGEIYFSAV